MVQAMEETEQLELGQAMRLLGEMNSNVRQVGDLVDHMLLRVRTGQLSTDKGLSFLEMKYQMLISYLINLTQIVLRKCTGEKIESDPSIDRLIEIRTVLEKIRPIDSKLKYQIDKLVKTAVVGATEDDPQTFRANPDNLLSKVGGDSESGTELSDDQDKPSGKTPRSNAYVPPKLAAVHFDESSKAEAQKKMKERSKKQMLNSNVMRELREEYSDAPMEVTSGTHVKHSISKYEQEKTEYEEAYLTRLPVTKAEKNRRKKLTTMGMLADEITGAGSSRGAGGSKKRKLKTKKGKGFKKRRIH